MTQDNHEDRAIPDALLLTADETARLLRTSRAAVYAMVGRRQFPGVTRLGSRVLFRSRDLLDWLDQKRAQSPREQR
jgi:excisionase family DNA binding protein